MRGFGVTLRPFIAAVERQAAGALTTTGFYLALRRIRNDIMLLFRLIDRRKPVPAERSDPVGVDGRAA
jgi:hypothetical protein